MLLDLTEREKNIACYALHRFATNARDRFDVACQKRSSWPLSDIEASRFLQDAKDAEALIERLRAGQGKEAT